MESWPLPSLIRDAVRESHLKAIIGEPPAPFDSQTFSQHLKTLIKRSHSRDTALLADTARSLMKATSADLEFHRSSKLVFLKTFEPLEICIKEIKRAFDRLHQVMPSTKTHHPLPQKRDTLVRHGNQWIKIPWIPKELRKGSLKIPPPGKSPTHIQTVQNALEFAALCSDALTHLIFGADTDTKAKLVSLSSDQNSISLLLKNVLEKNIAQTDLTQASPNIRAPYSAFCHAIVGLLSEWLHLTLKSPKHHVYLSPEHIPVIQKLGLEYLNDYVSGEQQDDILAYRCVHLLDQLIKMRKLDKKRLLESPEWEFCLLPMTLKRHLPESLRERQWIWGVVLDIFSNWI